MKRLLTLLLVACMIFSMFPQPAVAAQAPKMSGRTEKQQIEPRVNPLYAHALGVEDLEFCTFTSPDAATMAEASYVTEAEAAVQIREYLKDRTAAFTVYVRSASDDYQALFKSMLSQAMAHTGVPEEGDFLRFQYGGYQGQVSISSDDSGYYYGFTYNMTYYTTAEQEAEMDTAVDALLAELALTGMTDYEKVCAVYDYICANITYDHANLNDSSYKLKYTAYAALVNKTAVCQGYAVLLYRLLMELGVDIRVITGIGNGGGHAWNILELDDLYYNADSTWDATWHQAGLAYNFFLRNEENFTEGGTDHIRDEEYSTVEFMAAYPMSETDYAPKTASVVAEGTCGEALTWVLTDDGVLTISGTGDMYDYPVEYPGWYNYVTQVRSVVIQSGVTSLGDCAFYQCNAIESVSLPDSLTKWGTKVFTFCSALKSISIPDGITEMGTHAFQSCYNLAEAKLPANLTVIPAWTFGETAIQSIVIPETVTQIDNRAFGRCPSAIEITFTGNAPAFHSETFESSTVTVHYPRYADGWTASVLRNYGGTVTWLGYGPAKELASGTCGDNLTWKLASDGILTISGEGAMSDFDYAGAPWYDYREDIIGIIIKKGVVGIGSFAFYDCSNLMNITIPEDVISIGSSAFDRCTSLMSIVLPNSLTIIGDEVFFLCSSLTSITLPESLNSIGTGAFVCCDSLTSIAFPDGLISIGDGAFLGCISLSSITLPERLTSIGSDAFADCSSLSAVFYRGTEEQRNAISIDAYNEPLISATWHYEVTDAVYDGQPAYLCGKCHKYFDNIGTYLGDGSHTYAPTVTPPTCTERGYTTFICSCGDSYVDDYVDATGHNYKNGSCVDCGEPDPDHTPSLSILSQPDSYVGSVNDDVTFTVEASGNGLTYAWFYSDDGGASWKVSHSPGYLTNTLQPILRAYRDGYLFYCRITDVFGNTVDSDVVSMVVKSSEITITEQPTDVESGIVNQLYTFKVTAAGDNLTYRWEYSEDGGNTWLLSWNQGYNADTLKVRLYAYRSGYLYRCVVTSGLKTVLVSEPAELILQDPSVEITSQSGNVSTVNGKTITFHVEAVGNDLTYAWYRSNDKGATWTATFLTGYNTDTLSFAANLSRTAMYMCKITDGSGKAVWSEPVKLTLLSAELKILTQPTNITCANGETASFTVEAQGDALRYLWYASSDGGETWTATYLSGYNTATLSFTVNASRAAKLYKCVITDAGGNTVETDAVKVLAPVDITQAQAEKLLAACDALLASVEADAKLYNTYANEHRQLQTARDVLCVETNYLFIEPEWNDGSFTQETLNNAYADALRYYNALKAATGL